MLITTFIKAETSGHVAIRSLTSSTGLFHVKTGFLDFLLPPISLISYYFFHAKWHLMCVWAALPEGHCCLMSFSSTLCPSVFTAQGRKHLITILMNFWAHFSLNVDMFLLCLCVEVCIKISWYLCGLLLWRLFFRLRGVKTKHLTLFFFQHFLVISQYKNANGKQTRSTASTLRCQHGVHYCCHWDDDLVTGTYWLPCYCTACMNWNVKP